MSLALVLGTVNGPFSEQLDALMLARCLTDPNAALARAGHMSSFFGEVEPALQVEFARQFDISDAQLKHAAKTFAAYSGESLPARGVTSSPSAADWKQLFRIASKLIRQVNLPNPIITDWTFGGGTALMLQVGHRDSRDIDIFLPDPQFLPFLNPATHDFEFEVRPSEYSGDGSRYLKLAFSGIGEIDFIVAAALTSAPSQKKIIEGEDVRLETLPEIITKKVYHRGAAIKPRDIFDIAACADVQGDAIVAALKPYQAQVDAALTSIEKLNPAFVARANAALAIHDRFKGLVETALDKAQQLLRKAKR